jgi:hypothetical protein
MHPSATLNKYDLRPYLILQGDNLAINNIDCKVLREEDIETIEVLVRIPEESLFDYNGDLDMLDWSKLFGLHYNRFPWQNS